MKHKAILNSPIAFKSLSGVNNTAPAGTHVLVDLEANVALIGTIHVDVTEEEYELLYVN